MTKELKTIDLNLLPIVTLGEMANESAEQVEKNAKATVQKAIDCGRYLTAIKEQLEHGQWGGWLGANWNYSHDTANRYMTLANSACVRNLIEAKSINEALRIISDSKPETVPRAERKPADVVVSIPEDYIVDANKMMNAVVDDGHTPDPPTQRKTAKGSEKVSEDKKQKTQAVVPELLDDDPQEIFPEEKTLSDFSFNEILEFISDSAAGDEKTVAKQLRKLADKLDPPTKFVKPDLGEVSEYFRELNAVDPDSFFDFYESKGWLVGKVSMKDWRASARKWVRENATNGKANGNGHATRNGGNRGLTAEDVFSPESLGRGR